jgi:hypothetical protein
MQNIDPIYILQPVIVIAICTALVLFWYKKRRYHPIVLVYALAAYAIAIALKDVVQIPTINLVEHYGNFVLGVYYGLQTVFFEVGLAFLFAYYAVKQHRLERKDAEAYGSWLAFWENAAFLGALSLIDLVAYYGILSSNTPLAQTLYNQLNANASYLFAAAPQALGSVAIGTLERISSIMLHFAWGYLCILAAVYKKKRLFLIALPMGFVDFLVPFATPGNIILFEGTVFALAVASVLVAWHATKYIKKQIDNQNSASQTSETQ